MPRKTAGENRGTERIGSGIWPGRAILGTRAAVGANQAGPDVIGMKSRTRIGVDDIKSEIDILKLHYLGKTGGEAGDIVNP